MYADEAVQDTEAISGIPFTRVTAKGKKSLVIKWDKVTGASGYDIFLSKCSSTKDSRKPSRKVKTIKGSDTLKWTRKNLKAKTAYKVYVKAWIRKDGKKKYVAASPLMHAFTTGSTKKYTNAKSVTVNDTEVTLAAYQTFQIKATVKKLKSSRKLMPKNHAAKVRYLSSDKNIATVTSKGVITADESGTCTIYVYAHNGVRTSVKVTVESIALPDGLDQYLKDSANCPATNTTIKTTAKAITAGLTDEQSRAKALFEFVRDKISYSFYYDTQYGALGTLNNKEGNCVDQAHLLVAFLRAAGIPARYCHGTVTFTNGTTEGHVWVECTMSSLGYTTWVRLYPTSARNSYDRIVSWDQDTMSFHGYYNSLPF